MPFRWDPREHAWLIRFVLIWTLLAVPVGAVIGTAVAFFLWSLEWATHTRWAHPWLLFLLPFGGLLIAWMYHVFGRSVEAGNNLIVDQIHEPGGGVPARMAPLVLIGTVLTHLFGGSAGREGTAIQMGGSIASTIARYFRFRPDTTRTLLTCGIAAGFGAVFGVPLTGAVFAIEVLAIGRMSYESLIPCLIASVAGDWACTAWNVDWHSVRFHILHTRYAISSLADEGINPLLLAKVAIASMAFGLASVVFAELTHSLQWCFKRVIPWPVLRPVVGGAIVIGLVYAIGTRDYLGLGVSPDPHTPFAVTIQSCFRAGGATPWSWWWKILFTAVTLGSGFKGGEVTPLFFVGAALGNALARVMHAPIDLFAGLGFVAVFAGATNTPLACTIMAIELFGAGKPGTAFVVYAAVACCLAYLFSGHTGIYLSQRIGTPKTDGDSMAGKTLRSLR